VPEDISKRFRERIRALRIRHGWTQERAAEICGIGQKLFQLYEIGVKRNPGLLTLQKIARGFGLEVHQLLGPAMPRARVARKSVSSKRKAVERTGPGERP
jgi:transcriptional regulator with XRE-family HTH domain